MAGRQAGPSCCPQQQHLGFQRAGSGSRAVRPCPGGGGGCGCCMGTPGEPGGPGRQLLPDEEAAEQHVDQGGRSPVPRWLHAHTLPEVPQAAGRHGPCARMTRSAREMVPMFFFLYSPGGGCTLPLRTRWGGAPSRCPEGRWVGQCRGACGMVAVAATVSCQPAPWVASPSSPLSPSTLSLPAATEHCPPPDHQVWVGGRGGHPGGGGPEGRVGGSVQAGWCAAPA